MLDLKDAAAMIMRNLPNFLGFLRIIATPALVAFILSVTVTSDIAAIILLVLMAASDIADGKIARRFQTVSPLGELLDATSDKIVVTATLIPMVERGLLPGWVALVIVLRDIAISGLRAYATTKGITLGVKRWGRQKIVMTMGALVWRLVAAALATQQIQPPRPLSLLILLSHFWWVPMALALIWTVGSGIAYFWKALRLLQVHRNVTAPR